MTELQRLQSNIAFLYNSWEAQLMVSLNLQEENDKLKELLKGTYLQEDLLALLKMKNAEIERLYADKGRSCSKKRS